MEQSLNNEAGPGDVGGAQQEQTDAERREVLATIGRFIYAAPALALLAMPKASQAGYGGGGTKPGWGNGDKNHNYGGPPGLSNGGPPGLLKKK